MKKQYLFKYKTVVISLLLLTNILFGGLSAVIFSSNGQNIDIKYDYNSDKIREESYFFIDEIAKDMKKSRWINTNFIIEGHTDSQGSSKYNLDLSERRAESVKKYLTTFHAIDKNRLIVKGFGENQLIEKSNTEESHAINRRVILKANKQSKSFTKDGLSLFIFGNIKTKTETKKMYRTIALYNKLVNGKTIQNEIKIFNEDCTEKRVYQELNSLKEKPKVIIFVGDIAVKDRRLFFKTIDTDINILKRTSVNIDDFNQRNSLIILITKKNSYSKIKRSINLNNILILSTDNQSDRVDLLKKVFIVLDGSQSKNISSENFFQNIKNNLNKGGVESQI